MNMLKRFLLCTVLALGLASNSFAADVQLDCTNLVLDYAYHRDRPNPVELSQLFTEHGSLTVGADTWTGRSAILERLESTRSGPVYRHLMSTIRIFPVDDDHATGVSYVTVYNAPQGQRSVEGFAAIGEYHDDFVLTDEGWKIDKRVFVPIFFYGDKD